jgi:hypothetical protein
LFLHAALHFLKPFFDLPGSHVNGYHQFKNELV